MWCDYVVRLCGAIMWCVRPPDYVVRTPARLVVRTPTRLVVRTPTRLVMQTIFSRNAGIPFAALLLKVLLLKVLFLKVLFLKVLITIHPHLIIIRVFAHIIYARCFIINLGRSFIFSQHIKCIHIFIHLRYVLVFS